VTATTAVSELIAHGLLEQHGRQLVVTARGEDWARVCEGLALDEEARELGMETLGVGELDPVRKPNITATIMDMAGAGLVQIVGSIATVTPKGQAWLSMLSAIADCAETSARH
jgi:hypothetical protein